MPVYLLKNRWTLHKSQELYIHIYFVRVSFSFTALFYSEEPSYVFVPLWQISICEAFDDIAPLCKIIALGDGTWYCLIVTYSSTKLFILMGSFLGETAGITSQLTYNYSCFLECHYEWPKYGLWSGLNPFILKIYK